LSLEPKNYVGKDWILGFFKRELLGKGKRRILGESK
jgi:hypothetical protein